MTRLVFSIDALPSDVFALLLSLLSTFDLLPLSHVNSAMLSGLLANDADVWKQRLRTQDPTLIPAAKKSFFTRRTLQFPGNLSPTIGRGAGDRGGVVSLPTSLYVVFIQSSFSLSLWFALQPNTSANPTAHAGGILLGALSRPWSDACWPFFQQPYIYTDEHRNLYCSVTNDKQIVASNLRLNRWYHVVLTFHRLNRSGTQSVYVNGELAHASSGPFHREWLDAPHMQLGSGGINGCDFGEPNKVSGWYAFRGVIDDCSVWKEVLSPVEVKRLTDGDGVQQKSVWSLRGVQSTAPVLGDVRKVRCLPPTESPFIEIVRVLEPSLSPKRGLKIQFKKFRGLFSRR